MDTLSSMTTTPAEPIMVPAVLEPVDVHRDVDLVGGQDRGRRSARHDRLQPAGAADAAGALSINCRRVIDTGASYTAGFLTRPDTEYMRVPPCVLVPSPANHSAPRSMIGRHAAQRLDVVDDRRLRRTRP